MSFLRYSTSVQYLNNTSTMHLARLQSLFCVMQGLLLCEIPSLDSKPEQSIFVQVVRDVTLFSKGLNDYPNCPFLWLQSHVLRGGVSINLFL